MLHHMTEDACELTFVESGGHPEKPLTFRLVSTLEVAAFPPVVMP